MIPTHTMHKDREQRGRQRLRGLRKQMIPAKPGSAVT